MSLLDDLFEDIQKENSKYNNQTKEGLPILTLETLRAFKKEIDREISRKPEEKEHILGEWCKELESENPVLLCYIQESASRYPPDIQGVTFFYFVMFYQLLKSQAANDKILEYFNKVK